MYFFTGSVSHLAKEDDLQSKSVIKIVLRIVFNTVTIAVIIGSLLQNHQSHKREHLGKELECQLATEDDLQSVKRNCS